MSKITEHFKVELEKIEQMLAERRTAIAKTPKDEEHPYCRCGSTMVEHLQFDVDALKALQALLTKEDYFPLYIEIIQMENLHYPDYAVRNLYRAGKVSRLEAARAESKLDTLSSETLTKIVKWFVGEKHIPAKPELLSDGDYAALLAEAFSTFVIMMVQGSSPSDNNTTIQ